MNVKGGKSEKMVRSIRGGGEKKAREKENNGYSGGADETKIQNKIG